MLLPALAAVKQRAVRIKCLANVKQFGLAFISYGYDFNDKLPAQASGDWADHLDISIADAMLSRYGITRDICYCPGNPTMNNDGYWNNTIPGAQHGPHRILGYCHTLPNTPNIISSNWNLVLGPTMITVAAPGQYGTPHMTMPSTRTLVADMVPSAETQDDVTLRDTYPFFNVMGEDGIGPLQANHLDPKHRPIGGNEVMLDGHGQWVKFQDMIPRTTSTYAGDNDPVFWW